MARPVMSNSRHAVVRQVPVRPRRPPTRAMSSSCQMPTHTLPSTMKATPPNILRSVTPGSPARWSWIRSARRRRRRPRLSRRRPASRSRWSASASDMRAVSVGSESVSRMRPNTASIAAENSVIARECRLNHSSVRVSLPIARPTARNDTPSPSEYATSSAVERARLSPRAAKPSTRAEDRPDARRPAETERRARDRRRDRSEAIEMRMEAELLVQARRREQLRAREVARHEQHEAAGDPRERLLVAEDRASRRGRDEPEQHEHDGEAEHEQARC